MHLVNSFNNGTTNDFITPADSSTSGDPVTSAGPGCQYAHKDGHYCVISPNPGDELYWETPTPANWKPAYYLRFDLYIEAGQPSWGIQRFATLFVFDGVTNTPAATWTHYLWAGDDGRLYVEDDSSSRTIDLGIQLHLGEWNTLTFAQNTATGVTRYTITHTDGSSINSGPINFPTRNAGLYSVNLGRPGGMGSGGSTLYVDNLRGYNTGTVPPARNPHNSADPETPGPAPTPRGNDPDPSPVLDPDDPVWDPPVVPPTPTHPPTGTSLTPTSGTTAGGTKVTIVGTNLNTVNTVTFDGSPGTAITPNVAGTSMTVRTPPHVIGPVPVIITNPDGGDGSLNYTYITAPITPPTPPPDPWHPVTPPGPVVPPPKGVIVIPTPNQTPGDTFDDDEILYSTHYYVQEGCTPGPNQGVLAAGTVMAYDTTDKRWYAYNQAGTNGRNTARAILRRAINTTKGPQSTNILVTGCVRLSAIHGLTPAAMTQLGAVAHPERDLLRF